MTSQLPANDLSASPPCSASDAGYGRENFPAECPLCGASKVNGYVRGWLGWACGTNSHAHHTFGEKLNLVQSIPCAVSHWKNRALKAEMAVNAMQNVMAGKLVAFDCCAKTLGFAMDEMPSTAWLGQRVYLCLPNSFIERTVG